MKRTIAISILCGVALVAVAEPTQDVCLPNIALVGVRSDVALSLVATNAPNDAVRPLAVQILMSGNRNIAITATYLSSAVTLADVTAAVTGLIGREPITDRQNTRYWTIEGQGHSQFTTSVSLQSGRIKVTFAKHPAPEEESETGATEHQHGPLQLSPRTD